MTNEMNQTYKEVYPALIHERLQVLETIKRDLNAKNSYKLSHVMSKTTKVQQFTKCKAQGCPFNVNYNYHFVEQEWVLITATTVHDHFVLFNPALIKPTPICKPRPSWAVCKKRKTAPQPQDLERVLLTFDKIKKEEIDCKVDLQQLLQ